VRITVNGTEREIREGLSVEALLIEATGSTRGSAVVVDGAVVPRGEWARQRLRDGQQIELITAVQGG
jgi:sulfur carrier protein